MLVVNDTATSSYRGRLQKQQNNITKSQTRYAGLPSIVLQY